MSRMTICNTCGEKIAKSAKTCPHCGARNKKKPSTALMITVIVLFCLAGIAAVRNENSNSDSKEKAPIKVVFDALQYRYLEPVSNAYITCSESELVESIGEPEKIDVWDFEKGGLVYEIRSLTYAGGNYVYEFNNDYLIRVQILETFEFENKEDIPAMFGLERNPIGEKVDTPAAYRIYDCGINDLWCTYGEKEGTIDITYISYSDIFE